MASLLIHNIGLLVTPLGNEVRKGIDQKDVFVLENAYILIEDEIITKVGTDSVPEADVKIDAKGKLVTPGLVDAHTHLVFGGFRQNEMKMKLDNVPYLDILKAGGGILSTVKSTREASKEDLIVKSRIALDEMIDLGTTLAEAKSGYGLSLDTEIKQLEVVKELNESHPVDIVSTFMAAHAIPEEYRQNREEYIEKICNDMIPYVSENKLAQFCDVFCEKGVFTVEESEKILLKGQEYGLRSKIHADEIEAIGGSVLAGKINAVSAEHLIVCDEKGMDSLSDGNVIACLLPSTSFYLGADFAKARKMIEKNIPVVLASDYNPGSCPSLNMQLVMNLGCLKYRMTPEEVLCAVTLNAACAIDRADRYGSIETGKYGDVIIWDSYDLNYIFYRLGSNLVDKVIKKGKLVVDHEKTC